jgi:CBS domain-containing protein
MTTLAGSEISITPRKSSARRTIQGTLPLPVADAVTVRPEEPIVRVLRLLNRSGFAMLPVVDAQGALVGMITESDLLLRLRSRRRSRWAMLFMDTRILAQEYRRAMGRTVAEVMGPPPTPIQADASAQMAADLLWRQGLRDLPVVTNGRVTGMVNTADLLTLLEVPQPQASLRTDAQLVAEMEARLAREPWVSRGGLHVEAREAVLSVTGCVDSGEERTALEVMAATIPGCQGVEMRVLVRETLRSRGV